MLLRSMAMIRRSGLAWAVLASSLVAACRQVEPSQLLGGISVSGSAQKREEEFRWKERCASAAERFDRLFAPPAGRGGPGVETSVSETFYSPARNSCICETSTTGKDAGKSGSSTLLTLYDCLTREDLGETIVRWGAPESDRLLEDWKREKAALK